MPVSTRGAPAVCPDDERDRPESTGGRHHRRIRAGRQAASRVASRIRGHAARQAASRGASGGFTGASGGFTRRVRRRRGARQAADTRRPVAARFRGREPSTCHVPVPRPRTVNVSRRCARRTSPTTSCIGCTHGRREPGRRGSGRSSEDPGAPVRRQSGVALRQAHDPDACAMARARRLAEPCVRRTSHLAPRGPGTSHVGSPSIAGRVDRSLAGMPAGTPRAALDITPYPLWP